MLLLKIAILATAHAYARDDSGFHVTFQPQKDRYELDEPIRFIVRDANQPFFLYLFSIDRVNDSVEMILPHEQQPTNIYGPHQTNLVPDKDFEFYSSRIGEEELLMIASPEVIPDLQSGVVSLTAIKSKRGIELKRSLGIPDAIMNSVVIYRFRLQIDSPRHR